MDHTPADRPKHPGTGDRFNEEKATYALRGADAPDLEAGVKAIRNVLKTLPARPGVYRMQDAKGEVPLLPETVRAGLSRNEQFGRLDAFLEAVMGRG